MLVITRKPGETIVIDGGRITIKVLSTRGKNVRVGIDATRDVKAVRGEVFERIKADAK